MSNFLLQANKPGFLRVLAAIFYDLWLVAALWLLGTTVYTFIRHALGDNAGGDNHLLLQVWLAASPLLFFGWFWTHGGQTLGMRAWRIRVVAGDGGTLTWRAATRRYFAALLSWALLGLGFVWIIFDRNGCSWHDRLSRTYLVMTEKRGK